MKALVLFSGGLDSTLAVKLLQEQEIKVVGYHFSSPFLTEGKEEIQKSAEYLGIPLIIEEAGSEYFKMLKNPEHGYGSAINPCIDCRIFVLRRAKETAERLNIPIIATGEVLDERPMTQTKNNLKTIEKEANLKDRILRPLSARKLPKTKYEKRNLVKREKLLGIQGRSRKNQLALAEKYQIKNFPTPAGGCLLTEEGFGRKVKDLFENKEKITREDVQTLKLGRHFRSKDSKIIVGKDEEENKNLLKFKDKFNYVFEVPNYGSPITLLEGKSIKLAARLTARYSDAEGKEVTVKYGKQKPNKRIVVSPATQKEIEKVRI